MAGNSAFYPTQVGGWSSGLRNLLRAPRRSLMTVTGIGAVISVVIALGGMIDSFDTTVQQALDDAGRGGRDRIVVTLDAPRAIGSADVNAYLEEITGQPFTAKDFRTWAATVLAALALAAAESFESEAAAKRNVTRAIEQVAAQLGNTVAVCRKSYVHPEIVECYLERTLLGPLDERAPNIPLEELAGLRREEIGVLALLQQRAASGRRTGKAPTTPVELKTALEQSIVQESAAARAAAAPV